MLRASAGPPGMRSAAHSLRRAAVASGFRRAALDHLPHVHAARYVSQASPDIEAAEPRDSDVMGMLLEGSLPHHRLEAVTGDPARAASLRRLYLEATSASHGSPISCEGLPLDKFDAPAFYESILGTNCENVIGYVPLPVGVVGPLIVDGRPLLVPLATTEGALVASTNRGARAVAKAGGIVSVCMDDGMTRAPLVECVDLPQAAALKAYCESAEGLAAMQSTFSTTSRFGKLVGIKVAIAGRHAYLRFKCTTGDAMGMNMVGKGVNTCVATLTERFHGSSLLALSGNFCTDKKPSAVNWIEGRGKSVAAEAVLPGSVVREVLKADPQRVAEVNTYKNLVGSALAGSIGGFNCHASNIVTALFLACGQDPAQNVESSNCIVSVEATSDGAGDHDLRIAVTMPSVCCGTVGGGTGLAAQAACLKMLGVEGSGAEAGAHAQQLARIVASTVLCGELSLLSALSSNHLISAHMALNRKPTQ